MTDAEFRALLDRAGVSWDDPIRDRATDFARRPAEEQNLWLFIEMSRLKPSKTPSVLNAVYTTATAVILGLLQMNGQK